jgi:RimJ/RimL family protein N-acetyltransferase
MLSTPSASADLPDALWGDRVVLRPYREKDAESVYAAINESREHLRPWVAWVDRFATVEDVQAYCRRCAEGWRTRSDLAVGIFDATSGHFLGGAGLHHPNWLRGVVEISCWLRASAAFRGYGTETLNLLADLAFSRLDVKMIKLVCDERNDPTRRMAAKCGYEFKGQVRSGYAAPDGQLVDLLVYSMTPEVWRQALQTRDLERARLSTEGLQSDE